MRRGARSRWAPAALVMLALVACRTRDSDATPEGAVREFVRAAHAGDGPGVFARLGPRTRQSLQARAKAAADQFGTRGLDAQDLVAAGWVPPSWEPSSVRLVKRHDDRAEVEVVSRVGDRQAVDLVKEGDAWRIELPLR